MASKIIVIGGINGNFVDVFKKVAALHAKNNFALAVVAGDLFARPSTSTSDDDANIEALLNGEITLDLPVYFALGTNPLPAKVVEKLESNNGELCPNLYFLGKRTTIKTSEGIRIVALGGTLDPNLAVGTSKDNYTPFYSGGDASALKGANTADILITSEWPFGVETGSKVPLPTVTDTAPAAHHVLSELCAALKPRYHFSTSPSFYEREPFFHPPTDPTDANTTYPTTRFISLAPFNNPTKSKWIYAFTLDPGTNHAVSIPPGTTASPFTFNSKKRPNPSSLPESFTRFDHHGTNHHHHEHRPRKKGRKEPPPGPDSCFFCLSNPAIATHLIASIGSDAYLTTAKGPLPTGTTFAPLAPTLNGIPSHILIIPLAHAPTLAAIPDSTAQNDTIAEMRRYRRALDAMVEEVGNNKLGSVCWEVSRAGGIHTHWQWMPIAAEMAQKGLVEAACKVQAQNEGWDVKWEKVVLEDGSENTTIVETGKATNEHDDAKQETDALLDRTDSFRLWVRAGGMTTLHTLPLTSDFRFDLQFGRRVIAKLLGLEKRVRWQDCGQSEEEETREAEAFKKVFEKHDFSLVEDGA